MFGHDCQIFPYAHGEVLEPVRRRVNPTTPHRAMELARTRALPRLVRSPATTCTVRHGLGPRLDDEVGKRDFVFGSATCTLYTSQ